MARISLVEEPLFGGFSGPMGLSDCSEAYTLVLRPSAFPSRTDSGTLRQSFSELSRLPHMERMHMQQVSDSGELNWHSRYRTSPCCLPIRWTWSALPNGDFGAQYCAYAFPC